MATYKYNTLATTSTIWQTSTGSTVEVGYKLTEETRDLLDMGEYTRSALNINIYATLDGKRMDIIDMPIKLAQPRVIAGLTITHTMGKLALTDERLAAIKTIYAELAQHPDWQARLVASKLCEDVNYEFESAQRRLDNVMTLNGKSY